VRPLQKNDMQYTKARQNERQFKSLTSLSVDQFDTLLPIFESKWDDFIEKFNLDGTPRMRKYVPKNEKQLPTVADKLFFILFYQKTNSLQELVASYFDLDVSMVNKWIHILSPLLDKSLVKYAPKSRIEDVKFKKDETYITDGSERPIQRDTYQQEEYYSGKKGTHTMKNALIISTLGLIVWLSVTHVGRVHDKKMVEKLNINTSIILLADLGFFGWHPKNVNLILPYCIILILSDHGFRLITDVSTNDAREESYSNFCAVFNQQGKQNQLEKLQTPTEIVKYTLDSLLQ
jgi:hypothetical protein